MLISKPSYFDDFKCIASLCPDSCCKEWDVQVDDDTARFYRSLSGPLGDRLREVLRDEDGETVMTICDGRCPMWRQDGLCRIQAELGEAALCKTCREFPRLTHDYGDFVELGLELSCPEAARIILTSQPGPSASSEIPGGECPEYDSITMALLKSSRKTALDILALDCYTPAEALALLLLYSSQAQSALDCGEEDAGDFDPDTALQTIRSLATPGSIQAIADFFTQLEILTPQWQQLLQAPRAPVYPEAVRLLGRYFVERYWLQSISDDALTHRVKFILICCILICAIDGDFISSAQLFSKEIENNYDNVEAILDAAYTYPGFADLCLLGLLLGLQES